MRTLGFGAGLSGSALNKPTRPLNPQWTRPAAEQKPKSLFFYRGETIGNCLSSGESVLWNDQRVVSGQSVSLGSFFLVCDFLSGLNKFSVLLLENQHDFIFPFWFVSIFIPVESGLLEVVCVFLQGCFGYGSPIIHSCCCFCCFWRTAMDQIIIVL